MAPQLQDVPNELLADILGYLPKSDLKSARLTCARYGHIGAQWLFQRVYFAPRKAAIDTFLNISANPTFARTGDRAGLRWQAVLAGTYDSYALQESL